MEQEELSWARMIYDRLFFASLRAPLLRDMPRMAYLTQTRIRKLRGYEGMDGPLEGEGGPAEEAYALGRMHEAGTVSPEHVAKVVALLDRGDRRYGPLTAVGQIGGREAIPRLLEILEEDRGMGRKEAASLLGEFRVREAVPALLRLLRMGSEDERKSAHCALESVAGFQDPDE